MAGRDVGPPVWRLLCLRMVTPTPLRPATIKAKGEWVQMLDASIKQLTAARIGADGPRLEALSSEADRVRLAVECIQEMAVGLPDDMRATLDRIEALAALAACRLQSISVELDDLARGIAVVG